MKVLHALGIVAVICIIFLYLDWLMKWTQEDLKQEQNSKSLMHQQKKRLQEASYKEEAKNEK